MDNTIRSTTSSLTGGGRLKRFSTRKLNSQTSPISLRRHTPAYISLPIIFLLSFLATYITSSLIATQPNNSHAATNLTLVSPTPTMTLSNTTPSVNLSISPTLSGASASSSHTITATTNMPTGYNLALTLLSSTHPNSPAPAPSPTLTSSSGTLSSPTILSSNTWGFAIPSVTSSTPSNTILNGFNTADYYTIPVPHSSSKWAGLSSTLTTIKNTTASTTPNISTGGDGTDPTTIYYGARADFLLLAGTYTNTIEYTATANNANLPTPTITSITPTSGTTAGGTVVTIVGTGFTTNDESITHSVVLGPINADGSPNTTSGGASCTNVSISSNTPSTNQDTIYCTTPSHPTAGAVDVHVATWGGKATSTTASGGGFTYIAPTPTITAPTNGTIYNAGTATTTLNVTTNTPAICYYGTSSTPTTAMSTTGTTTHSQSITGLSNQSTNTYYVRCQATTGHSYGTTTSTTFYIRAATPAVPTLSPAASSSVNTGTTTITVTSATSGSTCKWGTSNGSYPYSSGTTRTTTAGTNTLYYSCTVGSGNTASTARTGQWSYVGVVPLVNTMQAFATEQCSAMSNYAGTEYLANTSTANLPTTYIGKNTIYLNDVRNGQSYRIRKMQDGKCWMIDNLKIYNKTLTSADSDIASGSFTLPSALNTAGSSNNTSARVDNPGGRPYCSSTVWSSFPNTTTGCGYLYNWFTATAGQGLLELPQYTAVNDSICPKNWNLPANGVFPALNAAVSLANGGGQSWQGVNAGNLGSGGFSYYDGTTMHYWTGFSDSPSYYARSLYVFGSSAYPASSENKYYGYAVRCVL